MKKTNEKSELLPIDRTTSLEYLFQISRSGMLTYKWIKFSVCVEKLGFDFETSRKLGWTSLYGWKEIIFKPEKDLSEALKTISAIYPVREPPIRCPRLVGAYAYFKEEMSKGLPSDIYIVEGFDKITLCAKLTQANEPNCPYE